MHLPNALPSLSHNADTVIIFADPPEITSISSRSLVAQGQDGVLECSAEANPSTAEMISWRRPGFDLSSDRVTVVYSNGTSRLTVSNVTKEDTGEFECHVDNGVGVASARARLLVKRELLENGRICRKGFMFYHVSFTAQLAELPYFYFFRFK